MSSADINDIRKRMDGALANFTSELKGLRTGRASVNLLDSVMVEAYGNMMPISQVASVSAPEARLLTVQVWDQGNVKAVEKAIQNAGLGLNPAVDGTLVRIPTPELSEERRKELTKIAAKFAEQTRIAIRNVRRDGMDALKKLEKDGKISKDEHHGKGEDIQKVTDEFIKKIDDLLAAKEKEIMQV